MESITYGEILKSMGDSEKFKEIYLEGIKGSYLHWGKIRCTYCNMINKEVETMKNDMGIKNIPLQVVGQRSFSIKECGL